jgi:hypothetical protein
MESRQWLASSHVTLVFRFERQTCITGLLLSWILVGTVSLPSAASSQPAFTIGPQDIETHGSISGVGGSPSVRP